MRTDGCWGRRRGCLVSQEDCVHKSENVCLLITDDSIGMYYDPGESYYEKSILVILRTKLSSWWRVTVAVCSLGSIFNLKFDKISLFS